MSILLTDKQSTQQRRLEKLVMTYESYPMLICQLNAISKWFSIFSNEKTLIFTPNVSSATATFAYQKVLIVIVNLNICSHTNTKCKTK